MTDRTYRVPQIITLVGIAGLAGGAAVSALGFPARARVYPLTVAVAAFVLAALEVYKLARQPRDQPDAASAAPPLGEDVRRAAPYAAWGLGFYLLIWTIGLVPASVIFVIAFLARHGRVHWPAALGAGLAVGAVLTGLGIWLDLRWPRALFDLILLTGLF